MAGYIDSILPAQTQPQVYTEILTNHVANGVPVSSAPLVNVGLSLTQYVSEASSTALNLARTVFRGLFADSINEDITAPRRRKRSARSRQQLRRSRFRSIKRRHNRRLLQPSRAPLQRRRGQRRTCSQPALSSSARRRSLRLCCTR